MEVWFGTVGNLNQVYNGAPITSLSLASFEPLTYNTNYDGRLKVRMIPYCCRTNVVIHHYADPNLNFWCDDFASLNNWTIVGPSGMTNWSASNTSQAGGTPPELYMSWSPSFTGVSKVRSVPIPLLNNTLTNYTFNFYLDFYANPSGVVTVGITYDGGIPRQLWLPIQIQQVT